jgi:Major Facilitator Superfamily
MVRRDSIAMRHLSICRRNISGLLGLAAQTPAGAAIDATRAKRGAVMVALAVLAVAALVIFAMPTFVPVLAANTVMAVVGDVFGPAVAALTLGLFSARELASRMGRNSAFDHAGNIAIAAVAGQWGRKPILLAAFAVLPIRAFLYTMSDNAEWLITVQVLDGIGAGILGTLTPLIVADLTRGTGRYNLSLGAVATVQGIGASLSGLAAGVSVDHFGYSATFLTAGCAAAVALVVCLLLMPETAPTSQASASLAPCR